MSKIVGTAVQETPSFSEVARLMSLLDAGQVEYTVRSLFKLGDMQVSSHRTRHMFICDHHIECSREGFQIQLDTEIRFLEKRKYRFKLIWT